MIDFEFDIDDDSFRCDYEESCVGINFALPTVVEDTTAQLYSFDSATNGTSVGSAIFAKSYDTSIDKPTDCYDCTTTNSGYCCVDGSETCGFSDGLGCAAGTFLKDGVCTTCIGGALECSPLNGQPTVWYVLTFSTFFLY